MSRATYMLAVGVNPSEGASADEIVNFKENYVQTEVPAIVESHPGMLFAITYEQIEYDPDLLKGPHLLTFYDVEDEATAVAYAKELAAQSPAPFISLVWKQVEDATGTPSVNGGPFIYLSGQSPAPGTDEQGEKDYNDLYTNHHIPELVGCCHFLWGVRYKLHTEVTHPAPGAPKYLALYEASPTSFRPAGAGAWMCAPRGTYEADPKIHIPEPENGFTVGPPSWVNRVVTWRLSYARVGSHVRSSN